MSDENQISLPNYIIRSLAGAWKLVLRNPKAMEHLDLSIDGFWKSFWAIAVMVPLLLLKLVSVSNSENAQVLTTDIIFFVVSLPLNALVMYYFTRFMKIDKNYISMVIATNWISVIIFGATVSTELIFFSLLPSSNMSVILFFMIFFYFNIYIAWFTYKVSLDISGALAIGVLIFVIVLSFTVKVLLMEVFDPEAVEMLRQQISNPPA